MNVPGKSTTPLHCPICERDLDRVAIRDIGGVTSDLVWQVHAGSCLEHGWFQAEIVSRPPREIFGVTQPFGAARRLIVDGEETYAFPTVWNDLPASDRLKPVDLFDPRFWRVSKRSALAASQPGPRQKAQ